MIVRWRTSFTVQDASTGSDFRGRWFWLISLIRLPDGFFGRRGLWFWKSFLAGLMEGEESHLPVQNSWTEEKLTAAAWGADGLLLTTQWFQQRREGLAVISCCQRRRLVLGLLPWQEALDRGILRFWGVVPVLPLWVGHKGSPLHTALVERFSFLALGGPPQQTVFWNRNLAHRIQQVKGGWLLLVCHFLDALQTF